MREVDHFRQEKCVAVAESAIISFPSFRFGRQQDVRLHSGDVVQDSGDVGRRSGGCGPPER